MSRYEGDTRVQFSLDGTATVGQETVRHVPGDGWCVYQGEARVGAGFASLDTALLELIGPAVAR